MGTNPHFLQSFHRHPAECNTIQQQIAGCSMQQDPPARTMVLLFSAEGNNMQQLFTSVALGMVRAHTRKKSNTNNWYFCNVSAAKYNVVCVPSPC